MPKLDKLAVALVKDKSTFVYTDSLPNEVQRFLLNSSDSNFVVSEKSAYLFCPECNLETQHTDKHCWYCKKLLPPTLKFSHSLSVKLTSGGIAVRGLASAILACWNPCHLHLSLAPFGSGTQIKVELKGTLSTLELALFCLLCSLLCSGILAYLATSKDSWFWPEVVGLWLFSPFVFCIHRKTQERQLIEFSNKLLQELQVHHSHRALVKQFY